MPRWGGGPGDDWYPWIREVLAPLGRVELEVLAPPDPQTPTIEAWTTHLREAIDDEPKALARTLVVGHSVGCQAVLRWAASLADDRRLGAALLVAGWWAVDEPWPAIVPWMKIDYELDRVRAVCPRVEVMLGLDDPFTADYVANAELWRTRLGARVVAVPGAKHFNATREPAVFDRIDDIAAGVHVGAVWCAIAGTLSEGSREAELDALRPGASPEQIDALERTIGRRLPEDLRRSLAIHDGGTLAAHTLLEVDAIAGAWTHQTARHRASEDQGAGQGALRRGRWRREWIPFARDPSGALLCVDLSPGPRGRFGQLVVVADNAEPVADRSRRYVDWLSPRAART